MTIEFEKYDVELQFVGKLYGGCPKAPAVIQAWLATRFKESKKDLEDVVEKTKSEIAEETEEKAWVGFKSDKKNGIFVEPRQLKAMFKETANTLGITKGKGSYARKQVLQHGFFVTGYDEDPQKIYVKKNGQCLKEADGVDEKAIQVMTMRGQRSCLKKSDYIEGGTIKFGIKSIIPRELKGSQFKESDIRDCLELGQESGIGANRTQESGKFKVVKFEKVN